MEPSDEKDGILAGELARQDILNAMRDRGPSIGLVMTRLKQSVSAKTQRASYDKDSGWQYSAAMIDHRTRLEAVKVCLDLYGAMPGSKHELEIRGSVSHVGSLSQELMEMISYESKS